MRHTKQQRIQGAVALALPSTKSETIWLTMTSDERSMYDATKNHMGEARGQEYRLSKMKREGGNRNLVEMALGMLKPTNQPDQDLIHHTAVRVTTVTPLLPT